MEMPTILENMERRRLQLAADPRKSKENTRNAVLAMYRGIGSTEWTDYMTQFASDEHGTVDAAQLARLTAEDGDQDLDRKRCYMIANSTCGMTTNDKMLYGCKSIDDGVNGEVCDRKWYECPEG
jgi:hypothetical protein